MCSYVSRNSSQLVPIKPKVVLVGTHKDQADEKHIKSIQRELKEILAVTEHYKDGVIVFASPDEPALTINSLSDDDQDASKIRHLVEKIANDPSFTVSVPAPWLALLLSLRLVESSVLSYEDCSSMANDCGIHGDEEIKEALWFLHTKLGVIRYFHQIPELRDIVICDPQVIFDKITHLITRTFMFEECQDAYASDSFRLRGVFPTRVINDASHHSQELLTCSKLSQLLVHLNIIAPIYDDGINVIEYFIPCALCHADEVPSMEDNIFPLSLPHLLITFKCGYVPKGIFAGVTTRLMKSWKLVKHRVFRNQITFYAGREYHRVTITFKLTHLEVSVSAETESTKAMQTSDPHKVCDFVRRELSDSILTVSRTLHYGTGAAFSFGFHCPSPACSGKSPAICNDDDPLMMLCPNCACPKELGPERRVWFGDKLLVCYL